ncbi:hypothetical protein [Miltoncostaea oceani]|uniref:hypothetical protein n=1 Tax=Miltoncostaea oceani TaxID=2843216 RepID=UPI001C3CBA53|nr:hypothetical protein [Miltoncostaea oceani]
MSDPHLGELPTPIVSGRHASHSRLRRACAGLLLYAAVTVVAFLVVSRAAAWAADAIYAAGGLR